MMTPPKRRRRAALPVVDTLDALRRSPALAAADPAVRQLVLELLGDDSDRPAQPGAARPPADGKQQQQPQPAA